MTGSRGIRFVSLLALFALAGCSPKEPEPAPAPAPAPAAAPTPTPTPAPPAAATPRAGIKSSGGQHAVIETDKGPIQIEFLESDSPKAVENFRLLAERGYYDGVTFHRIVKGFMLQGGDPQGTGRGGESAWGGTFPDDINQGSPLYQGGYKRGLLAMANRGPDTNGSQFFIMHQDYPLPPSYVIFARVTGGMDVVDAIAETPTTMGQDGQMSKPLKPVVMKKVTIRP